MKPLFRGRKRLVILLVASAHAYSLLVSSFGNNAFVFLSSRGYPRSKKASSEKSIRNRNGIFENGKRSAETTTRFVFSRLGDTDGRVDSTKSNERTSRISNTQSKATSTRGYCPKCKRPDVVCICHALPEEPIDCGTRILILQHPREAKKRKRTSTVPLIGLSLQNVEICVGTTFQQGSHPLLDEALAMNDHGDDHADDNVHPHALLLYPSDGATPLQTYLEEKARYSKNSKPEHLDCHVEESSLPAASRSNILVVVDGTWAQTQSMVQNSHSTLQKLPTVMFDDRTHSLFDSLRQEPAEHCTSTLEAVSRAILLLGAGTSHHSSSDPSSSQDETASACNSARAADALEKSLSAMVDGQLRFALDRETSKPRYVRKNETETEEESNTKISKRQQGRTRKMVSRKLQANLSLPQPKTEEELELERIRFVYIAHMG